MGFCSKCSEKPLKGLNQGLAGGLHVKKTALATMWRGDRTETGVKSGEKDLLGSCCCPGERR